MILHAPACNFFKEETLAQAFDDDPRIGHTPHHHHLVWRHLYVGSLGTVTVNDLSYFVVLRVAIDYYF